MGYASTQINLPEGIGWQVRRLGLQLARMEPATELDTNPHVTVLYGLHSDDPEPARKLTEFMPSFEMQLGYPGYFEGVEEGTRDVVFLTVQGIGLQALRRRLEKLPRINQHRDYVPHLTLGYVPLGKGAALARDLHPAALPLANQVLPVREFTYSERKKGDGTYRMHEIPLRSYYGAEEFILSYIAGRE